MRYFFSKQALSQLQAICQTNTLYAFDYDGTLAPLVPADKKAVMLEETSSLLKKLDDIGIVAIISGRSLNQLLKLLTFKPKFLIGNHGLESQDTPASILNKAKKITSKWLTTLKPQLENVFVENKQYTLTLHIHIKSHSKKSQLLKLVKGLSPPPRLILGHQCLNLIPSLSNDKGTALQALMHKTQSRSAFFIGDDVTDEDVFRLNADMPHLFSLRVEKKQSSLAHFFIHDQEQINDVLRVLISSKK